MHETQNKQVKSYKKKSAAAATAVNYKYLLEGKKRNLILLQEWRKSEREREREREREL